MHKKIKYKLFSKLILFIFLFCLIFILPKLLFFELEYFNNVTHKHTQSKLRYEEVKNNIAAFNEAADFKQKNKTIFDLMEGEYINEVHLKGFVFEPGVDRIFTKADLEIDLLTY